MTSSSSPLCACGRGPRRPGQRTCLACHRELMRRLRHRAASPGDLLLACLLSVFGKRRRYLLVRLK